MFSSSGNAEQRTQDEVDLNQTEDELAICSELSAEYYRVIQDLAHSDLDAAQGGPSMQQLFSHFRALPYTSQLWTEAVDEDLAGMILGALCRKHPTVANASAEQMIRQVSQNGECAPIRKRIDKQSA